MSVPWALSVSVDGVTSIFMGRFSDKLGPRKILIFSGLVIGLGFVLMSRITDIWQMYFVYGIIVGVGCGSTFVPTLSIISRWFIARRNLMNGFVLSSIGVGTLIISPLAYWLISTYQWRTSYIIMGIGIFLIIFVAAQFMRSAPSQIGQEPYNKISPDKPEKNLQVRSFTLRKAIQTLPFWLIFVMSFSYGFVGVSIAVHLVPHIIHLNIPASTGAMVLAASGGANIVGRLIFGVIGDRIGSKQVFLLCLVLSLPVVVWLIYIQEVWMLYLFAVIYGICQGGMATTQVPLIAEFFGLKSLGAIFGACGFGTTLGAAIGPLSVGYLFDVSGGYQSAFLTCAFVTAAGIILNIILMQSKPKGELSLESS